MNKKSVTLKTKTTNTKQTPKVISKRQRRKSPNDDICNERRQQLLELILKTNSIRRAANELGINNSTAKSIFYKYKQTGQINKNPRVKGRDEMGSTGQHCPSDDQQLAVDERMEVDSDSKTSKTPMI